MSLLLLGLAALLGIQASSHLSKRQAVCQIHLQAWGFDDCNGRNGYIIVGGKNIINTTRTTTYTGRGFFIAVVNFAACSASGYTNYDTYGSSAAATALATYLQGLSANTVIVCVTADSVNSANNQNLAGAVPALQKIGIADAATLDYRGKLAFVAQIGNPSATVEGLLPRNVTNAYLAVTLTGGSGSTITITKV